MSYSLESSKRKLSRLLDAISESPRIPIVAAACSNGSQIGADGLPTAKRLKRLPNRNQLGGLAGALLRNGSSSSLHTGIAYQSVQHTDTSAVKDKIIKTKAGDNVAPFNPSSRSDFLSRLRTFSYPTPLNWTLKPTEINEVQWAKHGWICYDKEKVECLCCRETFKVVFSELDLEPDESNEEYAMLETDSLVMAAVEKLSTFLVDAHAESCPWRSKSCSDAIFRLPIHNSQQAFTELRDRYCSLLQLYGLLPPIENPLLKASSISAPQLLFTFERWIKKLNPNTCVENLDNPIEETARITALSMALFGFSGNERVRYASATCHACWRRIGFWLYQQEGLDGTNPPRLELHEAHRDYCPWVNPRTQNAGLHPDITSYSTMTLSGSEILLAKLIDIESHDNPSKSARPTRPASAQNEDGMQKEEAEATHQERLNKWQHLKKHLSLKSRKAAV